MPACASPETVIALMRLRSGADTLYTFLLANADDQGCGRMTEAEVARQTGRSLRWVVKATVELKTHGWLEGGHGFWRLCLQREQTCTMEEQTMPTNDARNVNKRAPEAQIPPPLTLPTPV